MAPADGDALAGNRGLDQQGVVVKAQLPRGRRSRDTQFTEHAIPVEPLAVVFLAQVQQRAVLQGLHRQGRDLLLEPLWAAHREHFLIEQPQALALLETAIAEQHRHINIAAQGGRVALTGDQADIHLRVGLVKAMQAWHQPIGGEGKVGGDLQHFMLALLSDGAEALIDVLQAALHMLEQQGTGVGQFDAAVNAIKQADRQLLFKAFDLLADRRLGGAQLHRGRGETAMTRRCLKGAQQIEREVTQRFIHKLNLS